VNRERLQEARERLGLPPDMRADASAERLAALTGLTRAELRACLELCIARLNAKRIDPGASAQCCLAGKVWGLVQSLPKLAGDPAHVQVIQDTPSLHVSRAAKGLLRGRS
jgi:hypothetical protein